MNVDLFGGSISYEYGKHSNVSQWPVADCTVFDLSIWDSISL